MTYFLTYIHNTMTARIPSRFRQRAAPEKLVRNLDPEDERREEKRRGKKKRQRREEKRRAEKRREEKRRD